MENFKIVDGKKYMWDGENYPTKEAALEKEKEYQKNGFETYVLEEAGAFYLFSRRLVTEIEVAGQN